MKVSSLVLEAFKGPRPPGAVCRHFPDRDRKNNRPNNLCYGTVAENIADSIRDGTFPRGDRSGNAKLTSEAVRAIRNSQDTQAVLAERYGVSQAAISSVIHRKTWKLV